MQNTLLEALQRRYATKQFDKEKKVSDEDMHVIRESLRNSPSSFGLQPRKFIEITNQETKNSLVEHSWNQGQVADCSHLFVLARPIEFGPEDVDKYVDSIVDTRGISHDYLAEYKEMMLGFVNNMPIDQLNAWTEKQIYIALGFLMETCALLNIDACPIEGFIRQEYDNILGLEKMGLHSVVVCAVGYRSQEDKYASLPKVRYPQNDVFITVK